MQLPFTYFPSLFAQAVKQAFGIGVCGIGFVVVVVVCVVVGSSLEVFAVVKL